MKLANLDAFLGDFADVFDVDTARLAKAFDLPKSDEWESVALISTIALVDEHFNVTLKADDLVRMKTLNDLFTFVEQRV